MVRPREKAEEKNVGVGEWRTERERVKGKAKCEDEVRGDP